MRLRLTIIMLMLGAIMCNTVSAQEEDETIVKVNFKGARPTIVDFAKAYFDFIGEGEGYSITIREFNRYLRNKPVTDGILLVDKANGYLCYTHYSENEEDPDDENYLRQEMCYWNCADGKHKLVAANLKCYYEGRMVQTEVTGCTFMLYDNATRTMHFVGSEEYGAFVDFNELYWPATSEEEFAKLDIDVYRYFPVLTLPEQGKNIAVTVSDVTLPGNTFRTAELIWNGSGFTKTFSK